MKIAVIGDGNMGAPLGALAKKAGHTVAFATRKPTEPLLPALAGAEMVILAVPYEAALGLAEQADVRSALTGKTLIDITNPLAPDFMSLTVGHTSSAGEEIARRLPGVPVVKAFNSIFAEVLKNRAEGRPVQATVLVAGDDEAAKRRVSELVRAFGLEPVDAGPLSNARYMEALAELLIQLAYGKGMGTKITFPLVDAVGS